MGLFKHNHWWRIKTGMNLITDPATGKHIGGLLIEDCACGEVRTIEFRAGEAPIVRMASHVLK